MKKSIRLFYRKLWWLDVLYPFILSLILLGGLSFLVYSGQKHRRISAKIEERLLDMSLRLVGARSVKNPHKIISVSLQKKEPIQNINTSQPHYYDAKPEIYAKVISNLVTAGASHIFVQWKPSEKIKKESYKIILSMLEELPVSMQEKIFFAIYPSSIKLVPKSVQEKINILESDPCETGTQLFCIFNIKWSSWIMQTIPALFWSKAKNQEHGLVISSLLPKKYPTYIMHLNDPKKIEDYSFQNILSNSNAIQKNIKSKIVFIGNDIIQGVDGKSRTIESSRVRTTLTPKNKNVKHLGTPLHKFWAQQAQLFIDDDLISIAPLSASMTIVILLISCVFISIVFFNIATSMAFYLAIILMTPILNAFTIKYFRLYIPPFDALFAGMLAFLLLSFIKISFESFKYWKISLRHKLEVDTIDAKGNFISLISHNLNTPVAKMQGMLSLLEKFSPYEKVKQDTTKALSWVANIQLCIKTVLISTAIDENKKNIEAINIKNIILEFKHSMSSPLKRMGLNIEIQDPDTEDDQVLIPVRFDKRQLLSLLAAVILSLKEQKHQKINIKLSLKEDSQAEKLVCSYQLHQELDKEEISTLQEFNFDQKSLSLIRELSLKLLDKSQNIYKTKINVSDNHKPHSIVFSLSSQ